MLVKGSLHQTGTYTSHMRREKFGQLPTTKALFELFEPFAFWLFRVCGRLLFEGLLSVGKFGG
jgi:hypothetical protein